MSSRDPSHDLPCARAQQFPLVVAGLVPAIPIIQALALLIGIAGTSPAMTSRLLRFLPLLLFRHLFARIVGRIHIGELEGALAVHLHDSVC